MKTQHWYEGNQDFSGEFSHRCHEKGKSFVSFCIPHIEDLEVDKTLGILTIGLHDESDIEGLLQFCKRMIKENLICPFCGRNEESKI